MNRISLLLIALILMGVKVEAKKMAVVYDTTTVKGLSEIFQKITSGEIECYDALTQLVQRGENIIDTLERFLFTEFIPEQDTIYFISDSLHSQNFFIRKEPVPNKIYAVLVLDAILSNKAFNVLMRIADSNFEEEIKAEVIKSLAFNYYYKFKYGNENLTPRKEVLRVLIEAIDDTTYNERMQMKIGHLARQGIKNWTGIDFGDLTLSNSRINAYHNRWWQYNKDRLTWNSEKKLFKIHL